MTVFPHSGAMESTDNNYYFANLDEQTIGADDSPEYNHSNTRRRRSQNTLTIPRQGVRRLSRENNRVTSDGSNQFLPSQPSDPRTYRNALSLFENPSLEPTNTQNQSSFPLATNFNENNFFLGQTNQLNPQVFFDPNDPMRNPLPSQGFNTSEHLIPRRYYEAQNAQSGFDIPQIEHQQQVNEHVSDRHLNAPSSASAASNADVSVSSTNVPFLSTNKRRKLGDQSTREVYYGEGINEPSSNEDTTRPYDHDIVLLCCVWCVANPNTKPGLPDYAVISEICNTSEDAAKDTFESIQNHDLWPGQNSPDHISSSVVNIWNRKNPGKPLKNSLLVAIGNVFHGQYESLRRFSTRNALSPSTMRDSAIGKSLHTTISSNNQAHSHTEDSQIRCKKIAEKGGDKLKPRCEWKCNLERRYLCWDCGRNFADKGGWKRHINTNYQTETWSCKMCQSTNVWSRKEQLIEHIENDHKPILDEGFELQGKLSYSNFRRQCIFRKCKKKLYSFRESKDHIAKCFESRKDWDHQDLRFEDEESVSRAEVDIYRDSPSERHDDDEPDGSARKSHGNGRGGNNNSSSAPGSSGSLPRPSPSQGSRGAGGFTQAGHSFGNSSKPSSASDEVRVWRSMPPDSILWGVLSQSKQIWSSKLHVIGRLGSGGRAVVDEVWSKGFTRTLALKTFKSSLQNPLREWRREIEIMAKLKEHPHIVKLVYIYIQRNSSALLIHPVADYDLDKYLGSYSATLKEQRNILLWFSCLASGLEFLHENGVIHHDIKPQNILVKDQKVLFADFGSSCTIDASRPLENATLHHTKLYAAPEVERGDFTTAADVFSLGCVYLEMLTVLISFHMWKELRALQSNFYHQELPSRHWALEWIEQIWLKPSKEALNNQYGPILEVCRQMTQLEKEKRPNAANINTQVNLPLHPHCDYGIRWSNHPEKSLNRKRPNQEAEAQSKRPESIKTKNANKTTDMISQPSLPIVSVSYNTSASSLSGKRPFQRIGGQWERLEIDDSVEGADAMSDVASHLSDLAVSETPSPSAAGVLNQPKSPEHSTFQLRDIGTKMLDRFISNTSTLEDAMVSGYSRYNECEGMKQHSFVHQKFSTFVSLKPTTSTLGRKRAKTRSSSSSTEYTVVSKATNNRFWSSRAYPNNSSSGSTKEIGSQFHKSFS